MTPNSRTREQARRIVRSREDAFRSSDPTLPRAELALESLRRPLSGLLGVNGFSVLLARALALAKRQSACLNDAEVRPDGTLEGLTETNSSDMQEACVVLVTHLIDLLVAFIGERLTLQILGDAWPKFDSSPNAITGDNET